MKKYFIHSLLLSCFALSFTQAQEDKTIMLLTPSQEATVRSSFYNDDRSVVLSKPRYEKWSYELRAGVNIGGASPIPFPVEIRKINSYNPKFNGTFEGVATHWFASSPRLGIFVGLRLEEKGMETAATVKNYHTEIINQGNHVSGYWTGDVKTLYNSSFLTLPVGVSYRLTPRWRARVGVYASYKLDGDFSGEVSQGYLRQGTPVGERVSFTGDQVATYNFSDDLRKWHWGQQIGVSWQAFKHFHINMDYTYTMTPIFKKGFQTISFDMYPLYMNVGFGYEF